MDTVTIIAVIGLAFISGITTLIGVVLALFLKNNVKMVVTGIGFSAGMMVMISAFELVPESLLSAGAINSSIAVLAGVIVLGLLNHIIPHTHLIDETGTANKSILRVAYLVAIGLILHDFPEGFAMANSYIYSPALGIMVALAIALHNIPEEFAMAVPIILTRDKSFLFKAAFISGLAEPAGAAIGLIAVGFLPKLTPIFMAFAAGAMIFVAIHELIPMAERYKREHYLVLGLVLSVLVYFGLASLFPGV